MEITYKVKIHPAAEGGFWAEVPALPGCFTQGETREEVIAMVRDAIEVYLFSLRMHGEPIPVEKTGKKRFEWVTVRAPRMA